MGQITIDYPDSYKAALIEGLRSYLGSDAEGLTDSQAARKALKRFAKRTAQQVAHRSVVRPTVDRADAVLEAAQAAASEAIQARKDAEDAEAVAVETAFGSDS